jgi:predicted metalloprotease
VAVIGALSSASAQAHLPVGEKSMDWQKGESSSNVEVDSGGGRRMGLGTIVVFAIIGWVFFKNPLALLNQDRAQPNAPTQNGVPA